VLVLVFVVLAVPLLVVYWLAPVYRVALVLVCLGLVWVYEYWLVWQWL
jgi:hypothetical protein